MTENIDYDKIYRIARWIQKQSDFDYTMFELEKLGLKRICNRYNVGYNDLNDLEKEWLWNELIAIAEDMEFKRSCYEELHWK